MSLAEKFAFADHRSNVEPPQPGRVRLRTLVLVRWVALAGQTAALYVVERGIGLTPPLKLAFGVVAIGVSINAINALQRPGALSLDDREATLYLLYDIVQTSALLYLTGGVENPFCVLILTPITLASSNLSRVAASVITVATIAALTALSHFHLPLPWNIGWLPFPKLYAKAVWLAWTLTTLFIAAYNWRVTEDNRRLRDAFAATQLALAREQRASAVGALAAAAAHELGSPLATIAIVAKELTYDLPADSPFLEEARLLLSEAARCRTILAALSQPHEHDGGGSFTAVPVGALAELVANNHASSGSEIIYETEGTAASQPSVQTSPEIVHGLGNLIQNASQFARERVEIMTSWDNTNVMIEIGDDGPGFPPQLLTRLGEPYLSTRRGDGSNHMGLGVFIAQSLLQRTGAVLFFSNGPNGGALVRVFWPRTALINQGS